MNWLFKFAFHRNFQFFPPEVKGGTMFLSLNLDIVLQDKKKKEKVHLFLFPCLRARAGKVKERTEAELMNVQFR
jgi:hypothetical protein